MTTPIDKELEDACREFVREGGAEIMDTYSAHEDTFVAGAKFERERMAGVLEESVDALRATLGWFALTIDIKDKNKWPKYVAKCESALQKLREMRGK